MTTGPGHSLLLENPVRVLSQTRSWYLVQRRRTVIKSHQPPAWYGGVEALRDPAAPDTAHTVADYLLLLVFTGLRRQEAVQLCWEHINLQDRTLTVPDPKNHVPHTLPLSDFVLALLTRRQALAVNGYVFPGKDDMGYLIEPKRQIAKVMTVSGVVFTLHDLRRTFATVAEGLDISGYTLKRLLNHTIHGDVTAGYIVTDVERLRGPMERISRFLCATMGMDEPAKVVSLTRAAVPCEAVPREIGQKRR